jgi:hypothetical protein
MTFDMSVCIRWTKEEDETFKSYYGKISCEEICKRGLLPGRTPSALYNRADALKFKGGNRRILHSFDEQFWRIPSHINAYWAGEIAADGCIVHGHANTYTLHLQISVDDLEHLKKFKNAIGYTGDIKFYEKACSMSKNGAISHICYVSICRAAKWRQDLQDKWGITPRKTFNIIPPSLDNNVLRLCYLCGYLDGDGTITADYQKGFPLIRFTSCSAQILEWFQRVFDSLFPNTLLGPATSKSSPGRIKTHCNYYSISGFRAMKIFDIMSRLPVPKMDRKWKNPRILAILEDYKARFPAEWAQALPIESEISNYLSSLTPCSPVSSAPTPLSPCIPVQS